MSDPEAYTPQEMMVAVASREIGDGQLVFVGMRLAIVTTMAVYRFPEEGGEAYLASVHPRHSVDEVRAETGWDLRISPEVETTISPSAAELEQIRRFDPDGFWTRPA